jgi:hypothetical protein
MFGSRDQRKGSTAFREGAPQRDRRSVCVAYGDADKIERRRRGAREEREVGSGVKARDKQGRDSSTAFCKAIEPRFFSFSSISSLIH